MSPKKQDLSKLRWAAYLRQSRTSEANASLPEQRDTIERSFTGPNKIEIPDDRWFEDQDVSGKKMRRKNFDRLMKLAADGKIDGIVVARVSRFARTLVGALAAIKELDDHGVKFASATEPLDTTTATGKMLLGQFLLIAQWELDRITEQWDYFQGSAIDKGIHIGHGNHYGYRKGEDRKLYPIPEAATVVKEIFRRRAQRQTYSEIARWLNDEYPRTGKYKWSSQTVKSIITSRIYVGWAFSGDKINSDAHEPIVTLAQWDAANRVVPPARKHNEATADIPLLAGIIRCAGCRYAMTKITDKTGTIRAYKCNRTHPTGDCPAPAYVKASDIEHLVEQVFGFWHFHSTRTLVSPDQQAVLDLEDKLVDLDRRFQAVADDDARLEAMGAERFNADLRRRRIAIDQTEKELQEARAAIERDTHRPTMLAEEWESFDREQRRDILRRAIDAVYVTREQFEDVGPVFMRTVDGSLFVRTLIKWAHEDNFDKPGRGHTGYTLQTVPWPDAIPVKTARTHETIEGADVVVTDETGGRFTAMWIANTPRWIRAPRAVGGLILPPDLAGITAK
jgi:site-specific DNA recombinase